MCTTAGQTSHNLSQNDDRSFKDFSNPRSTAIDMGLGTAVNLDRRSVGNVIHPDFSAAATCSRPLGNSTLPSHFDLSTATLPAALTIRLPTSSNASIRGGRIIPIQIENERTVPSYQSSYKPVLWSEVSAVPSADRLTPVSISSAQCQPVLNELVHPSQLTAGSPVADKDEAAEYQQENDDVFDDKLFQKPPSFGTCKYFNIVT